MFQHVQAVGRKTMSLLLKQDVAPISLWYRAFDLECSKLGVCPWQWICRSSFVKGRCQILPPSDVEYVNDSGVWINLCYPDVVRGCFPTSEARAWMDATELVTQDVVLLDTSFKHEIFRDYIDTLAAFMSSIFCSLWTRAVQNSRLLNWSVLVGKKKLRLQARNFSKKLLDSQLACSSFFLVLCGFSQSLPTIA